MKMKKRIIFLLVAVMAVVLLVASPLLAKNIYVDGSNGGYANGVSWETAYPNLQPALDEALSGDIIKVAEGTYTPGNNRNDSFVLKSGVNLYGGYPRQGHGIRDCRRHFTILSGEIGTIGDAGDNVFHVVRGDHVNDARLDGFIIAGGNTTGSTFDERQGGGLRLADCDNITLDRCTFRDNRGAHGGALAVIAGQVQGFHLFFAGNQATSYGGAVYVSGGSIELTGTEFQRNSASTGGGMAVDDSGKATVGNALFNGSRANIGGGLCVCNDSSLLLRNVTVCNSTASNDGA
ncbi:MAG: hypothetical protein GXO34_01185, partial [Deltaproteobacteria bacterium]|nr:hypothetical protein [Deltaproteobacteria bacterium]